MMLTNGIDVASFDRLFAEDVDGDPVLGVHLDERPVLGGSLHHAEDLPVIGVDPPGVGHEHLEARDALVDQQVHSQQRFDTQPAQLSQHCCYQLWAIVVLTDMPHDQVLQAALLYLLQQPCGLLVRKVSPIPAYPLLQRVRVRSGRQHIGVIVAFHHQGVATLIVARNRRADMSQITQYPQPQSRRTKHKLAGFPGIVGDRYRLNNKVAYCKSPVGVNNFNIQAITIQ